MSEKPIVRGLKLCQQVIVEEGTRNYTLVNCFTELPVRRIPSEPKHFLLHAVVSDSAGELDTTVAIYRLDDLFEVYRRTQRLSFGDRLVEYRLVHRVTNFVAPTLGKYEACLLVGDQLVAHAAFIVVPKRR